MGYNYNEFGDIDEHHKKFPNQPMMLTEERTAFATRGVYITDSAKAHLVPTDWNPKTFLDVAQGMQFCSTHPFLAGIFYWTGFEYHGEPDPFGWPQVTSQFGLVDLCGFPKDQYYYIKSAWMDTPMVHIGTHWNWPDREGQSIYTKIYSNCDSVELLLNGKSLEKKVIPHLSTAVWEIPYQKGTLTARGYKKGKLVAADLVETTGDAAAITLSPMVYKSTLTGNVAAIVNVQIRDNRNRVVPVAMNEISFAVSGPAKIIGVGNGDPSSHDPEVFTETNRTFHVNNTVMTFVRDEAQALQNASSYNWKSFQQTKAVNKPVSDSLIVVKAEFDLPAVNERSIYTYFVKDVASDQSVYLNGKPAGRKQGDTGVNTQHVLDHALLKAELNTLLIIGKPFVRTTTWQEMNTDPGVIQEKQTILGWKRKAFNGLAQVILLLGRESGKVTVTATSQGLQATSAVLDYP